MTGASSFRRQDRDGIAFVTMDRPGSAANLMDARFKAELSTLIDAVAADRAVRGMVLSSAKRTFFAGGDLDAIAALGAGDGIAAFADAQAVKALLNRLERLGKPVVAAIAGSALGGGLELALACHARLCVADPAIRLGFPEVTLGLLPGAGGVVRTVHMLGLRAAIPLIVEGTRLSPDKAHAAGLVDALVAPPDLLPAARAWIDGGGAATKPWFDRRHRAPGGGVFAQADGWQSLQQVTAGVAARTKGLLPAPGAALGCAADVAAVDFATGEGLESRVYAALATGAVAQNLIRFQHRDLRAIRRGISRPAVATPLPAIGRAAVVGAGMMGRGIALAHARAGIDVLLLDTDRAGAERGRDQALAVAERLVGRGEINHDDLDAIARRIVAAEPDVDLASSDLVIEAVFEDAALKRAVLRNLSGRMAPGAMLASNTSALSITALAEETARPGEFVGLHFFSPVERMPLVEVVRGADTTDQTLARALDHVAMLAKTPIVVASSHGFFASRVFQKFIYEGAAMIAEGVPPALIENAASAAGYPAGPLSLLDDTALTLSVSIIDAARAAAARRGEPPEDHPGEAVIRAMVDHGRGGRAAGGGFYDYPAGNSKRLWSGIGNLFPPAACPPVERLAERFLIAQAVDALRCLDDGILGSVAEANAGSVLGIGFPRWTGGVIQWVRHRGAAAFLDRAASLAGHHGARFALASATAARVPLLISDGEKVT